MQDRKVIDPYFIELNAPEYHRRIMGNVKTIATIQQRSRMAAMPNLAGWVAQILEPVYERYHDRELRDKLRERVDKMKKTGDLAKIAGLLDNEEAQKQDFMNFRRAMAEYNQLRDEHALLENKLQTPETFGRETGREVAALVSGLLAGIVILAFAFLYLTQQTTLMAG